MKKMAVKKFKVVETIRIHEFLVRGVSNYINFLGQEMLET